MEHDDITINGALNQLLQLPVAEQQQFAAWVFHVLGSFRSRHRPWASDVVASHSFTFLDALTYLKPEEQGLAAAWFLQVVATVKLQERPWITIAEHLPQQHLLGMWYNVDTNTGGLTRLHIVYDAATGWTIQGWGRCSGGVLGSLGECEWERVPLSLLGASVIDLACHQGYAQWSSGFKRTTLTLELDDMTLVARLYEFFMDGSQRQNMAGTVYLQRKPEENST